MKVEPIIAALEQWHKKYGSYPASLYDLVPAYIDVIEDINGRPVEYEVVETTYSIRVRPAVNTWCDYTPNKQWDCAGYI